MSKAIIGVDIGACDVKFAVCDSGSVRKLAVEPLPDNLVRNGRIVSPVAMSDALKKAAKDGRISGKRAAVTLPPAMAFTRKTVMPAMTVEQLKLNLPYEFRDFITHEKDKYVYDYAVLDTERDEAGTPTQTTLMAAAALKADMRSHSDMFRRAGFKLKTAVPEELAYSNLIRNYERLNPQDAGREHCILDLGHDATRIYIFTGPSLEASRAIDIGGAAIDSCIADAFNVDEHLAHTYKHTNHEGALEKEACLALYATLAVEIMRAINFYSYNNPASSLRIALVCGGGFKNAPLMEQLARGVNLELQSISVLLPGGGENSEQCALAIGAALQ